MEYAIEVRNLTKRYKDFTLDDISFALPSGTVMGLIGENGAGTWDSSGKTGPACG